MRIMFWNTYKNTSINQMIGEIAKEKDIDIIFLAEYEDNVQALMDTLDMQSYITLGCDKIRVIGRKKSVQPGVQGTRYSIQIIEDKYILCAIHLPSQMSSGHQERRNIIIQTILNDLQDTEKKLGSKRSIIFGDFNSPPGTYYYAGSNPKCSYWHIFDQVMIRPCLRGEFIADSLEIIIKAGKKELLNAKGHPNKEYSDHLPIIFEIQEDQP